MEGEAEAEARFCRTRKGGLQLFYAGHVYNREDRYWTKMIWKCSEYRRSRCKGRCQTLDFRVVKVTGEHNHEARGVSPEVQWLEPAVYRAMLNC